MNIELASKPRIGTASPDQTFESRITPIMPRAQPHQRRVGTCSRRKRAAARAVMSGSSAINNELSPACPRWTASICNLGARQKTIRPMARMRGRSRMVGPFPPSQGHAPKRTSAARPNRNVASAPEGISAERTLNIGYEVAQRRFIPSNKMTNRGFIKKDAKDVKDTNPAGVSLYHCAAWGSFERTENEYLSGKFHLILRQ